MPEKRMLSKSIEMGVDENRTFTADLARWAEAWGNPASVDSCTLYDKTLGQYVNEKLSGAAIVSGTEVESKRVTGLVDKHYYQLNVLVNFPSSQKLSGYFPIVCRL